MRVMKHLVVWFERKVRGRFLESNTHNLTQAVTDPMKVLKFFSDGAFIYFYPGDI